MNERLRTYTPSPVAQDRRLDSGRVPEVHRPSLGLRLLGWTLLIASVGLVSCQSLFVL